MCAPMGAPDVQETVQAKEVGGASRTALRQLAVLSDDKGLSLGNVVGFFFTCTFLSPFYVGSPSLHLGLPLPEEYPEWMPGYLRLPSGARDWADRAVKAGILGEAAPTDRLEIKYGVLRGIAEVEPEGVCEPCETARRAAARDQAATDLSVIGDVERERRRVAGTYMAGAGSAALAAAIGAEAGLSARFWATMLVVLGGAFLESARTGL